jgi:hypothetical protein
MLTNTKKSHPPKYVQAITTGNDTNPMIILSSIKAPRILEPEAERLGSVSFTQ